MKKKFLFLFLIIIFLTCGCSNKNSKIANLDVFDFNCPDYGITSKVRYDSKGGFENFKVESNEFFDCRLYFENSKLKSKFFLRYSIFPEKAYEDIKKTFSKSKNYKEIKYEDHIGYVYSPEGTHNTAKFVFVSKVQEDETAQNNTKKKPKNKKNKEIKKEDSTRYFIAFLDVDAIEFSEDNFVFKTISDNKDVKDLLSNIDLNINTDTYYKFINSKATNEENSENEESSEAENNE